MRKRRLISVCVSSEQMSRHRFTPVTAGGARRSVLADAREIDRRFSFSLRLLFILRPISRQLALLQLQPERRNVDCVSLLECGRAL